MRFLLNILFALTLGLSFSTSSFADKAAADACVAKLDAPSKKIFDNAMSQNINKDNARDIISAEAKKLMAAGELGVFTAKPAAQAAVACIELAKQ